MGLYNAWVNLNNPNLCMTEVVVEAVNMVNPAWHKAYQLTGLHKAPERFMPHKSR
jgi:hypothetical protein